MLPLVKALRPALKSANYSFLASLKNYTGPTRLEGDTIGEMAVPADCLWGAQTQR